MRSPSHSHEFGYCPKRDHLRGIAHLFADERHVAGIGRSVGAKGVAEAVASIWGSDVIFAYVDGDLNIEAPSLGRTFGWTANTPSNGEFAMKTYREEKVSSWINNLMHDVNEKGQSAACDYILTNVIS